MTHPSLSYMQYRLRGRRVACRPNSSSRMDVKFLYNLYSLNGRLGQVWAVCPKRRAPSYFRGERYCRFLTRCGRSPPKGLTALPQNLRQAAHVVGCGG